MGNFDNLNPVRKRVLESIEELSSPGDITIGSTDFTFTVCGDAHTRDSEVDQFDTILKQALAAGDEFVVVLGDLTNWGKASQYDVYENHIGKYSLAHGVYNVAGNHDLFWGGWEEYKKRFGSSVYTFASENCRFIILDTANATVGKEQFDWLEDVLKNNTKENVFVFSHAGVFTGTFSSFYKIASQDEIYRLIYLFRKYGVDYMMSAHLHSYKQKEIEGIQFIITGGAGVGLIDNGSNHYVRVHVSGSTISTTKIDI